MRISTRTLATDIPRIFNQYPLWQVLLLHLGILFPSLTALTLSFVVTPDALESGAVKFAPPCLLQHLFEMACPACGMTRAFCSISHGEILRGFEYNQASIVLYPLIVIAVLVCMTSLFLVSRAQTQGDRNERNSNFI